MVTFKENQPKNIIVRMPNWIGDLVMATPILTDLRQRWPDAQITAMCRHNVAPLLEVDKDINELFRFKKPSGFLRREQGRDIIRKLRYGHYDLGLLLTHSFSSAWWFFRGGVNNRIGYQGHYRRFLLNDFLNNPKKRTNTHLVDTYKELLTMVGIQTSKSLPRLYVTDKEKAQAKQLLNRFGIRNEHVVVGINPSAAYGPAKCWLPERFRQVTEMLVRDPNVYVVFFGNTDGFSFIEEISQNLYKRVINLAGQTTLREFTAIISVCDVFLSNDSGPMHIAAALNKPLVALFGSTSHIETGPYNTGVVIHKEVACSPCFKRICPIDFRCMKRIQVDEVYEELIKLIKEKKC